MVLIHSLCNLMKRRNIKKRFKDWNERLGGKARILIYWKLGSVSIRLYAKLRKFKFRVISKQFKSLKEI
jgi:hypothetical protein